MKFLAVSTFNREGLDLYGRRMMASFARHWPETVELRVYSEGWDGGVDLMAASPWLADFKARHAARTFRDYRWDAVRFAHKAAAVCHAASDGGADVLIWLDGDIVTHSPIGIADLDRMAPRDEWIAWLDRSGIYPECGFYMLNLRHRRHKQMLAAFEAMYARDGLFELAEYHDSHVLQHVVRSAGIQARSLSGQGFETSHPLVNGPLGAWFDHAKGRRKAAGRTDKRELRVRRQEAYWQ